MQSLRRHTVTNMATQKSQTLSLCLGWGEKGLQMTRDPWAVNTSQSTEAAILAMYASLMTNFASILLK